MESHSGPTNEENEAGVEKQRMIQLTVRSEIECEWERVQLLGLGGSEPSGVSVYDLHFEHSLRIVCSRSTFAEWTYTQRMRQAQNSRE
jgi:hypothetical protein